MMTSYILYVAIIPTITTFGEKKKIILTHSYFHCQLQYTIKTRCVKNRFFHFLVIKHSILRYPNPCF